MLIAWYLLLCTPSKNNKVPISSHEGDKSLQEQVGQTWDNLALNPDPVPWMIPRIPLPSTT